MNGIIHRDIKPENLVLDSEGMNRRSAVGPYYSNITQVMYILQTSASLVFGDQIIVAIQAEHRDIWVSAVYDFFGL